MRTLTLLALASTASAAALQLPFSRPPSLDPLQQPDSSSPVDWPYRSLPWGDVNILSTTDTHGWLLGHQRNEPSFSGDWGDLYSFVQRMKEEARRRGVDLLLVDSGDRVDGNGLVDAEPAPNPKGFTALEIFSKMPYDVVTTGNHELYKDPVATYVSSVLSRKYGPAWVVSNVNLASTDPDTNLTTSRPMGNRYRKFTTEQGRRVTAFGPLFAFKAHGKASTVQKPSEMVKEQWFVDAAGEKPDFFLLAGHMSLRIEPDSEWSILVKTLRELHPTTPVLVFGGHHHIRDCVQEDEYSMSLAAGRYMETVGFMSVSNLNSASSPPVFKHRYLDQNRHTYAYHAGADFDTDDGRNITRWLGDTAKAFNLTESFGRAPQDYFLHRYPPTSPHSIFHLLTTKVLPLLIRREDRPQKPYTLLNTGSIRFDVFKGEFTRNDQWIILPFTNNFLYIPSVPLPLARKLLHYLNLVGEHGLLPSQSPHEEEYLSLLSPSASSDSVTAATASGGLISPDAIAAAHAAASEHRYRRSLVHSTSLAPSLSGGRWKMKPPTEGYVTLDACGGADRGDQLGDDTFHRPTRTARQPIFVGTELPEEQETVDVVFFDFIQPDILSALNVLSASNSSAKHYTPADVERYVDWVSANTLMEEYAKREWQ
ncbi:hypothetical protein JCM10213_005636 [Rhodosporidiobolus nylandii]